MKKILTIVGARPQFIKAAVVSKAIDKIADLQEVILHTGQHFDHNMSQIFFDELGIRKPDYNLGIAGGTHGQQTGRMIEKIEEVLLKEEPDCILLYGDTNSTLAGTIAASKLHIPIAHVEAGLRSHNMKMPEEVNRILTDRVSELLFTPADNASNTLLKEGIAADKIHNVGDVMYDAAIHFGSISDDRLDVRSTYQLSTEKFILITIHRAENTDDDERLLGIMHALSELEKEYALVWPLHPRTAGRLKDLGFDKEKSSIRFVEPVGYLEMLQLLSESSLVVTDSGGVQKEAYFRGTRCLVVRNETEWVELVEMGFNRLLLDLSNALSTAREMIEGTPKDFSTRVYGDGTASEKIATLLSEKLNR
jgi:UDP-GlcNAc3NAcA epimerase